MELYRNVYTFIILPVRGFINWTNSTETKHERNVNSSKLKYHVKYVPGAGDGCASLNLPSLDFLFNHEGAPSETLHCSHLLSFISVFIHMSLA